MMQYSIPRHGMGLSTGVNLDELVTTGDWICSKLQQRTNGSKVALAMLADRNKKKKSEKV